MPRLKPKFDKKTKAPKNLKVLVLGAGVMGARHIRSLLEVSEKLLEPRYGVKLEITAVDRDEQKLQQLPEQLKGFEDLTAAIDATQPDILVQAFNDEGHLESFKQVFAACPNLKAVLTEKPLTVTLDEAKEIETELRKRYLSMDTIINFSPAFDRVEELKKKYGVSQLLGFEGVWGKNRTVDPRPTIGIPSESVHALSIIADMFGQDDLELTRGEGLAGHLSNSAPDVIYEMNSRFVSRKTGIGMNFHASYALQQQERRVTAYYKSPKGIIAFEMDFDIKDKDQIKDRLRVYLINPKTGAMKLLNEETPEHILNGAEPGLLRNDKITAFNSLSLLNYIPDGPDLGPVAARLGTLDRALQVQGIIEQIKPSANFQVKRQDADPAALHATMYPCLESTTATERLARITGLAAASVKTHSFRKRV
jgi:predicted dehydrogenase